MSHPPLIKPVSHLGTIQDGAWRREKFVNWSRFQHTCKLAPPGSNLIVFDIASGPGHFSKFLIKQSIYKQSQITCFDISPLAIQQARSKGYQAEVLDITASPTPYQADVIFFLEAIEHIENPQTVFKNLHDSLRPRGYLIVSTPNYARWTLRLKRNLNSTYTNDKVIWPTIGTSPMSIELLKQLLQNSGFHIERKHHLFQIESIGRIWKKGIKPLFSTLQKKFPLPDYNYVPTKILPNLTATLILIRARRPQ